MAGSTVEDGDTMCASKIAITGLFEAGTAARWAEERVEGKVEDVEDVGVTVESDRLTVTLSR
jgi:hypothetical protein